MAGQKKKRLQMNPDFSPIKKQKKIFGNYVDGFETLVGCIVPFVLTRADKKESPYTKPIVDAFEEDLDGEIPAKWNVMKIAIQKGKEKSDGSFDQVPKSPASKIGWDVFIGFRKNESTSAKSIGVHLAKELTSFVKNCPQVSACFGLQLYYKHTNSSTDSFHLCVVKYDTKIPFMFRRINNGPRLPLSHYLFDKDVASVLKRCYSGFSKDDIAADDSALEGFFGSAETGREVLSDIASEEWDAF